MEANCLEYIRPKNFEERQAAWREAILSTCTPAQAEAYRNHWLRVDGGDPPSRSATCSATCSSSAVIDMTADSDDE